MGAGWTRQGTLAWPATRLGLTYGCRRSYLEVLADLESVGVFAPSRLGEAPQGHLVVEHGRRVGEGLRADTSKTGVCSGAAEARRPTADTYQGLVDDAQHEGVVQDDVRGVLAAEGDVGDGRVPLQPQAVQTVLQQRPTPRRVLLPQERELKDLQHTPGEAN